MSEITNMPDADSVTNSNSVTDTHRHSREGGNPVPEGWMKVSFGAVVLNANNARKPISLAKRAEIQGEYPYYGATGKIDSLNDFTHVGEHVLIGEDGANLVSRTKNLAFIVDGEFWVNNHAHVVKATAEMPSKYISYYVNSLDLSSFVTGSAQPKLNKANLERIPMPIAPLAEQKVIADQLDQLLAQVERTQTRLNRTAEIIKRFRQSVLAAAVSGKLTEDWRGERSCSPVSTLINYCHEKISDKRSLKFADKPFRPDEISKRIPETWEWVRLAKISEVVSGVAKGSKTQEETVSLPYLRVANVQRGYLDLREIKLINIPVSKADTLKLESGDMLFNEGGDIDKLGRGWIWEGQIDDCIHQNHVFRARRYSCDISSKFISYYGNSEGKEYFLREGTQSVNLANINKTTLSLLPIPLPPAEEQTEIVHRVETLFAHADKLEQQLQTAQKHVDQLTQSILAKAFRGELTAQWRKDNPDLISGEHSAEALLAKIKAEREAAKPKKKTRARKRRV